MLDGAGLDAYKAVLFVFNMALGIMLIWLQTSVKEIRDGIRERQREQAQEIKEVREELSRFQVSVPHQYVLREDFVRAVSVLDHKIDRFGEELQSLNRNLSRMLGGEGHGRP
ncbi:MAG: hypothetical protein IMW99_03735 [Firmicutes bacterium]|nr:hypothetical protein [Bacillota bacterium]